MTLNTHNAKYSGFVGRPGVFGRTGPWYVCDHFFFCHALITPGHLSSLSMDYAGDFFVMSEVVIIIMCLDYIVLPMGGVLHIRRRRRTKDVAKTVYADKSIWESLKFKFN